MSKVWSGEGMTQEDFMKMDECILCDRSDKVIGSSSKSTAHVFNQENVCIYSYIFIYIYNLTHFIL